MWLLPCQVVCWHKSMCQWKKCLHFHKSGLQSPPTDWPIMALNILNVPLLSFTLKAGPKVPDLWIRKKCFCISIRVDSRTYRLAWGCHSYHSWALLEGRWPSTWLVNQEEILLHFQISIKVDSCYALNPGTGLDVWSTARRWSMVPGRQTWSTGLGFSLCAVPTSLSCP